MYNYNYINYNPNLSKNNVFIKLIIFNNFKIK